MPRRVLVSGLLAVLGMAPLGCQLPLERPEFAFQASDYPSVFQAAKDHLRAINLELERVDAPAGVLTTAPRPYAGLATPWLPYATVPADAFDGVLHDQRLQVTVTFEPAPRTPDSPSSQSQELLARVRATIERVYRPGRRAEPTGIRLTSFAIDPALESRGLQPSFVTEARTDDRLARRIAQAIQARSERRTQGPVAEHTLP